MFVRVLAIFASCLEGASRNAHHCPIPGSVEAIVWQSRSGQAKCLSRNCLRWSYIKVRLRSFTYNNRIAVRFDNQTPLPADLHSSIEPNETARSLSRWWIFALATYILLAISVIGIKWVIVPSLGGYQSTVQEKLSEALGHQVTLDAFSVSMPRFQPYVEILGVRYAESETVAGDLIIPKLRAEISLMSLFGLQPRLKNLEVINPTIAIRLLEDGRWQVAGVTLDPTAPADPSFSWGALLNGVLNQERILVKRLNLEVIDQNATNAITKKFSLNGLLQTSLSGFDFSLSADSDAWLDHPFRFQMSATHPIWLIDKSQTHYWTGQAFMDLSTNEQPDLSAITGLTDIHIELGKASALTWLEFGEDGIKSAVAEVKAKTVGLRSALAIDQPLFSLFDLTGTLRLSDFSPDLKQGELEVQNLQANRSDGELVGPISAAVKRTIKDEMQTWQLLLQQVDAGLVSQLARDFGRALDKEALVEMMAEYDVSGVFKQLGFSWTRPLDPNTETQSGLPFVADIEFQDLAVERVDKSRDAANRITGFKGLDGKFSGNNQRGTWSVASESASFRLPELYPAKELIFQRIDGRGGWTGLFSSDNPLQVSFDQLTVSNPDLEATLSGSYLFEVDAPDQVDLQGKVNRANIDRVPFYLPAQLGPRAMAWLQTNLLGGEVVAGSYLIRGTMYDFPYNERPENGDFLVDLQVKDGKLTPTIDWPVIEKIDGQVVFNDKGLSIIADKGVTMGMPLDEVSVVIDNLYGTSPVLTARGKSQDDLGNMIGYVNNSPVGEILGGLLERSKGAGPASVELGLKIPLASGPFPEVNTRVNLQGVSLTLSEVMPELTELSGEVSVTPTGVKLTGLTAKGLGGPVIIDGGSDDAGQIKILARGTATGESLAQYLSPQLSNYMKGATPFSLELLTATGGADLVIRSDLQGLGLSLPAPFGKTASEATPLTIRKTLVGDDGVALWSANIKSKTKPEGRISMEFDPAGGLVWLNGAVGLPIPVDTDGIRVALQLPSLDISEWQQAFDRFMESPPVAPDASPGILKGLLDENASSKPKRSRVSLQTDKLIYAGRPFEQVSLDARSIAGRWQVDVSAQGTDGYLSWQRDDERPDGALLGRFIRLSLPDVIDEAVVRAADEPVSGIPALDVIADSFYLGDLYLGKLTLVAENQSSTEQAQAALNQAPRIWRLRSLNLIADDSLTKVSGTWSYQPGFKGQTTDIKIDQTVTNGGEMLARLGKGEIFKGGQGTLTGKLNWNGSPLKIDYPTLGGQFDMVSEKGRFLKADPGAAKLLGVMSLQSLARRLQFNFSDLFDEGFEYDKLSTSVSLSNGMATTSNFTMAGPAATVLMEGSLNLDKETQALDVVVLPDLSATGGSIIYSILAANPAVGVASLFADLVLKDQLAKVFSLRYRVTGPWAEPLIEEIKRGDPKAADVQQEAAPQ